MGCYFEFFGAKNNDIEMAKSNIQYSKCKSLNKILPKTR